MKTIGLLFALFLSFAVSSSNASITNATAYGSSQVDCYLYTWQPTSDTLTIQANQYASGMVWGNIQLDSPADPTLTIQDTINNDTGFPWTGYHVDVFMAQPFTISSPQVLNVGWTAAITQQPVLVGSQYEGQLDYTGGTPVIVGQILSFSYQVTFSGNATVTQNLVPVPEPSAGSLLLGGILILGGSRLFARRPKLAPAR